MTHPDTATSWVDDVVEAYRRGRPLALLFDYDGTLTPIVRHPSLALLPPDTRELLAGFAALEGVTLAVLSGRALDDVRLLVGLTDCHFAGSGGLEMDVGGERRVYPDCAAFDQTLAAVHEHLLEALRRFPGTWVERKPSAAALHFRGLLPLSAACFRAEVADRLAAYPQVRYRVVAEAIELTPAGGWHKGTAVQAVLDQVRREYDSTPFPVFWGDSANDEEGMGATVAAGGLAVGVGAEAPASATHWVPDAAAVAGALAHLYRRLSTGDAPPPPDLPPPEADRAATSGVIVVDADAEHRDRLTRGLTGCGWRVWAFSAADEADRVLSERADMVRAVLVDLDQPGLLGGRLLAKWGHDHPAVVRCGMSAASSYTAAAFRRMSGLPLLAKPVDPHQSDRQLRQMLAERSEHSTA